MVLLTGIENMFHPAWNWTVLVSAKDRDVEKKYRKKTTNKMK
jgi:hypothetical protein